MIHGCSRGAIVPMADLLVSRHSPEESASATHAPNDRKHQCAHKLVTVQDIGRLAAIWRDWNVAFAVFHVATLAGFCAMRFFRVDLPECPLGAVIRK
eukprot:5163299-Amphidinium_carterae.1